MEMMEAHFAETVIVNAPAFLFAVKETIFNPKAITPLTSKAIAFDRVICVAPYRRTRSSSPVYQPYTTHWMNANGDMRIKRSIGCYRSALFQRETDQFQTLSSASLYQIRDDRFECREERPKQSQD